MADEKVSHKPFEEDIVYDHNDTSIKHTMICLMPLLGI